MTPAELKALGISSAGETAESAYARVLLLGAPKVGKTAVLAGTAPDPLVLSADGGSSTKAARRIYGDRFGVLPFRTRADITKSKAIAKKAVAAGTVKTVIADSLTIMAWRLLDELENGPAKLEGFDLWRAFRDTLEKTVLDLCELPCHVFFIGHIAPGEQQAEGELPGISGSAKIRIPAVIDDWVGFDFQQNRKPHERMFLVGPQKNWNYGARSVTASSMIEPSVPALLKGLGLAS